MNNMYIQRTDTMLRGRPCPSRRKDAPVSQHPSTGLPTTSRGPPLLRRLPLRPPHPPPCSTSSSSTSASVTAPTAPPPLSSNGVPSPSSNPAPQAPSETFVWTAAWYPVAVTGFLDPARPHPFTLLGRDLVLWRDGSGAWRAFEDACPHRLAPLSEGRVEADGTLLCAYHAWRFDGNGKCTSIPQAESKEAESRACNNPRSCARAYPTCEAQGLLWVWGEAGREGEAASRAKPPATIAELEHVPASRLHPLPWFFRDLPYSHDFFLENVTDPAHVGVSHHNVAGNRYAADQYFDVSQLQPPSAQGGFQFRVQSRAIAPDVSHSSTTFTPPSLVKIRTEFKSGAVLILALYSCPTRPGYTRHIGRQILIRNPDGKLPRALSFFAAPLPVWLSHTLASLFLHQDQVFLHNQERTVAGRTAASHTAKYFMPTPADNMTVALRTWLAKFAGGRIPYAGTETTTTTSASAAPSPYDGTSPDGSSLHPPSAAPAPSLPPLDRSKASLFDTFHSHTAQCAVCSAALRNLRRARVVAAAAAVAAAATGLLVTAVAASAQAAMLAAAGAPAAAAASAALLRWPPLGAGLAAAVAAVAAAAVAVIDWLVGRMHSYEFSHADNH